MGDEYSKCIIHDSNPNFLKIEISFDVSDDSTNSISDFDKTYKVKEDATKLLKSLRVALLRLERLGYKWGFSFGDELYEIKAFYKDSKVTLTDAFGGVYRMGNIDTNIMKEVLKRDYNLDFSNFGTSQSAYSGAHIYLYFADNSNITQDCQLIKDIRGLKKKNRGDDREYSAFRGSIHVSHEGNGISINGR